MDRAPRPRGTWAKRFPLRLVLSTYGRFLSFLVLAVLHSQVREESDVSRASLGVCSRRFRRWRLSFYSSLLPSCRFIYKTSACATDFGGGFLSPAGNCIKHFMNQRLLRVHNSKVCELFKLNFKQKYEDVNSKSHTFEGQRKGSRQKDSSL